MKVRRGVIRRYVIAFIGVSLLVQLNLPHALAQDSSAEAAPGEEHALPEIVVQSTGIRSTLSDYAQPVTELSRDALDMKAATQIGDTLATEAGIASSSFGPGSARPVIRGLGGDRIRVLENGVGTNDISAVSPDHAVTIESALVDKVEVVRGPASLLYGTSALGGVVNISDNRIPEVLPDAPAQGSVETRGESVSRSRTGLASVTAPVDNVAVHVDALASKSDDYDIPGYARTAALRASTPIDYPEPKGFVPWSDTQTDVLTGGASYILEKGFAGASYNDFKTRYGVPNGEEDVSINAHRRRVDLRAGVRETGEFIESASVRAGLVDYNQTEFEGGDAGTRFKNNGVEARFDMRHREVFGIKGTWGAQFQGNSFEATGAEAFQPPGTTDTYSLFTLEELPILNELTFQAAIRYDKNRAVSDGFTGGSYDDLTRNFDLLSQSAGAVWDFARDYSFTWSTAYTQRAPNPQELFADGPHLATGVYEIGDPDLPKERSLGTDLTLRKNKGDLRGSIGGFYNRFLNYIAANPTGQTEDNLPVYVFEDLPADFWGFESQVAYFVEDSSVREVSFDFQPDYVWARDRDSKEYLPRIPPLRMKFGVNYYQEDLFRVRLELQRVFAQDKVAQYETTTDGYSMLNLYLSRDVEYQGSTYEFFIKGTNLLAEKARNHVSFIKDVAPLPGASTLAGMRVRF